MEPPSRHRVAVVPSPQSRGRANTVRKAVVAALADRGVPALEVTVRLTGDAEVRELNRTFRGIDEPTDVLTFPAPEGLPGVEGILGDIAISVEYAERQAALRGVSVDQEIGLLALHGTLHLLGLDDESDEDRARMQAEMARLCPAAGLPVDPEWASLAHSAEGVSR